MAIVFDGPVLPDDLTVFVREVPRPNIIRLDKYLPDRTVNSNRVDVGTLTKTGRTARFRAYDSNLHRNRRDTAQLTTVKLPPVSDTLAMGELERLQLEFARTGGTNQEVFVDAIYDDATALTENAHRRMELARGDVLLDGKFTMGLPGEPAGLEADYLVPSGNFVTPVGALWTDTANADPITDLFSWVFAYNTLNGFDPGGMILSRTILSNLLNNTKIKANTLAAAMIGSVGTTLLTRPLLDQALSSHGLPPILEVYDSQVDVDGTATRILPTNKVVFVPPDPAQLGYTAWGVSATALELVNSTESDMSFSDSPGLVGVVEKEGPPYRQFTFIDGVGMPVLENPNALMVGTVG